MRRTKNRLRNKYFKRVVEGQKLGIMKEFYAKRAAYLINLIFDYKYLTVFRPWWYEQNWTEHPLEIEAPKFHRETAADIELSIGINLKSLNEYLKQLPKRPSRKRKEKEPKEQPIRKLRHPESFEISVFEKGQQAKQTVIGEKAFSIQGYDFFIRYQETHGWVVSDKELGLMVTYSPRYKLAVKEAKQRMENNFIKYIEMVEIHRIKSK